jgi:septum formation protein
VYFNKLTQAEIEYYVDNFKPYDKAGAYACQEWIGAVAISKFEGDYYNVVGLPINKVYAELKKF